jgi:phospholipase/carboxylesterase
MVPFVPNSLPDLSNKYIFMSSGLYDSLIPKQDAERLFSLFESSGAKVSISWQNSGHELVMTEVRKAKEWFYSSSSLSSSS